MNKEIREQQFIKQVRKLNLYKFVCPKCVNEALLKIYLNVYDIQQITFRMSLTIEEAGLFWRQQNGFIQFFNKCMQEDGALCDLLKSTFFVYCVNSEIFKLRTRVKKENMSYIDFRQKVKMSNWCCIIGNYVILTEESLESFTEDKKGE